MEDKETLLEVVNRTIVKYLSEDGGDDSIVITQESDLERDFGIDSTEMICIALDIEKELGVSLKGVKFSTIKTPNDLVNAVFSCRAGTASA